MTKADIVENVSRTCGFAKKEAYDLVEAVFSIVKATLETGQEVKISGFGKFEVKQKSARRGRNPQTGESIMLDPRRVLTFRPSNLLRTAINGDAGDSPA